ncbi:MAG: hypothetical protein WBO70_05990, partial [Erysipelotrichaceae bacterium]
EVKRHQYFVKNPESTPRELQKLLSFYPNQKLEFYRCIRDVSYKAEAASYLLHFENRSKSEEVKKIGVQSKLCKTPHPYPLVRQIPQTPFFDFSRIPQDNLRIASQSAVTTESVFEEKVKWY